MNKLSEEIINKIYNDKHQLEYRSVTNELLIHSMLHRLRQTIYTVIQNKYVSLYPREIESWELLHSIDNFKSEDGGDLITGRRLLLNVLLTGSLTWKPQECIDATEKIKELQKLLFDD
jgi:hypothetical protein